MKFALLPIIPLAFTVFFLIRAEFRQDRTWIYILKPISSILMVLVGLLAWTTLTVNRTYFVGLVIGLVLSLVGDIVLMFQEDRRAFLLGLVAFLLGHVAYTITFVLMVRFQWFDLLSALVLCLLGGLLYARLRDRLGKMRLPVIVYMVVISLMVHRAIATLFSDSFSIFQAWMIVLGALLFYLSDTILALSRFGKPCPYHRISLAFYYSGQVLIALSASYFA